MNERASRRKLQPGVASPPANYAGRTRYTQLEYEALLANASIGIAFTRARRFFLCNPKFEEMFGWAPGEMIGQSGEVVYPSRDSYTALGRIVSDEEIKSSLAAEQPYREWLQRHLVDIDALPGACAERPDHRTVRQRQRIFGYTQEDLRLLLTPMAQHGEEPIGSMGSDTALAVFSDRPRFKSKLRDAATKNVTREGMVSARGPSLCRLARRGGRRARGGQEIGRGHLPSEARHDGAETGARDDAGRRDQ